MTAYLLTITGVGLLVLVVAWIVVSRSSSRTPNTSGGAGRTRRKTREELRLGYRYDSGEGSVFVHKQSVWTGVQLPVENSGFYTLEQIDAAAIRATQAIIGLGSDTEKVNVQYRLTHRLADVDEWKAQKLSPRAAWNPSDLYKTYIDMVGEFLRFRRQPQPVGFLLVQIDTIPSSRLAEIGEQMDAFLTGEADEMIPPDLAAKWEDSANRVTRALRSTLGSECRPMTRADRMWLIRKPLTGAYYPQTDDYPQTKPWGPGEFALWVDFNGENLRHSIRADLRNADVHIADRSETEDSLTSYTACLSVADWPADIDTRDQMDWMQAFASEGVELSFRMELTPAPAWKTELRKTVAAIESEEKEIATSNQVAPAVFDDVARRAGQALREAEVNPRMPGVKWQLVVQVSAPTQKGLDQRIEELIRVSRNTLRDTLLVHPSRYQWRMLESMLPGTSPAMGGATPYVRISTPALFGVGQPTAGTVIGDRSVETDRGQTGWVGDLIGWGGSDEVIPVHNSPHSALARHAPAGVLFLGQSGGGKSTAALLKFFQDSESGVQVRVLDPKQDFAQACYYLSFGPQVNHPDFHAAAQAGTLGAPGSPFQPVNPAFWKETRIVDVLSGLPGSLDPWAINTSIHNGTLLANEMLAMFLGPAMYGRFSDFVRDAVDRVARGAEAAGKKPTLWQVAETLADDARAAESSSLSDETKRAMAGAAREIMQLRNQPFAHLAFAENPVGLNLGDGSVRRLVMTLRGISLPDKDKMDDDSKWSERQRLGATIMYVLTTLNMDILNNNPTTHPVTGEQGVTAPRSLIVDESYLVSGMSSGRALLSTALAQGRSYNVSVVLIDQHARRIAAIEGSSGDGQVGSNTIQTVYAFLQRTVADANTVAPLLSSNNPELVGRALLPVSEGGMLQTGHCLLRDMDNRVAEVRIDVLFRELANAFETGASLRAGAQSRPISGDVNEWTFIELESYMDTPDEYTDEVAETPANVTPPAGVMI